VANGNLAEPVHQLEVLRQLGFREVVAAPALVVSLGRASIRSGVIALDSNPEAIGEYTITPNLARPAKGRISCSAPQSMSKYGGLRQWMIETIGEISSSRSDHASLHWRARALHARLIAGNDRLRGLARASYATAERILAAAIAGDLHVGPDALAPRLAAITAVTGLRALYDSREAQSLGPEPTGADLIELVNQVIDYTIAGLAAVVSCAP
jgi:hypothetical protein